jgi:hypothetical protein
MAVPQFEQKVDAQSNGLQSKIDKLDTINNVISKSITELETKVDKIIGYTISLNLKPTSDLIHSLNTTEKSLLMKLEETINTLDCLRSRIEKLDSRIEGLL